METTLHSEARLRNVRAKVGKSHILPSGERCAVSMPDSLLALLGTKILG